MSELVDLSLSIENGIITYPSSSHQRFESSIVGRIAVEGRETRKFTIGSHCATHIDSMKHFILNGLAVDEIPLSRLIGPAFLIHLGELAPKTIIQEEDIAPFLPKKPVERLVLRSDWSRFWNTSQFYQHWPVLSSSCAQFLVDRGVRLLGIDFPSPDPPRFGEDCSQDCPNHKLFFSHEIILVEYLTNLGMLRAGEIFLMVMPLKLVGFDGSPARVAAYSLEAS